MLRLEGVNASYGPIEVLFEIDLEIADGEMVALLGTNGAGKTTILRVISGLLRPTGGTAEWNGSSVVGRKPAEIIREGIVQMPGGRGVFPGMTVEENLEVGGYLFGRDRARLRSAIDRVLELFPALSEKRRDLASTLSGGQQQMLALAMVLLHDPEVLAIDELSLGLAPVLVQELLGVVERLKAEGMTIIIVEQSLNVALSIADTAVFLEKGQVRFSGPAAELAERDDLARAVFLGTEGG